VAQKYKQSSKESDFFLAEIDDQPKNNMQMTGDDNIRFKQRREHFCEGREYFLPAFFSLGFPRSKYLPQDSPHPFPFQRWRRIRTFGLGFGEKQGKPFQPSPVSFGFPATFHECGLQTGSFVRGPASSLLEANQVARFLAPRPLSSSTPT